MLNDLDEALDHLINRGRRTLQDFQNAADLLLSRQFIYRGDHGHSRAAETVLANRAYFEDLMLATGRRLEVDVRIGMVGTVPIEARGQRLRLDETMLLLALRFVYEEGIPARLNDTAEVQATTEEIVAKLEELSRRPRPEWKRLREMLDLFEGRGLVRTGEDVGEDDRNRILTLRPALLHAAGPDWIRRLEDFAAESGVRARSAAARAPIPDDDGGNESDDGDGDEGGVRQ